MRTAFLLLLVSCGPASSDFSSDYTRGWCSHYLACEDPAVLLFDGIETFEDCEALAAPQVVAMGAGCKFKSGKVKECLAALEALTCQEEGEPFDFEVPAACEEVFPGCDMDFSLRDEGEPQQEADTDTDGRR